MSSVPEMGKIYARRETTLSRAGRGINTAKGRVLGVQVDFRPEAPYPDALLPDGRILHIGDGKPEQGPQQRKYGNKAMLNMMELNELVPVYECIEENQYRYLGKYRVASYDYGKVSARHPDWDAYSFNLEPDGETRPQLPTSVDLGQYDGDIANNVPPERIASVVARFRRSKAIAEAAKARQEYRCQYCGFQAEWGPAKTSRYCEAHHVIPLGQNGFDTDDNLVVLCADCHRRIHLSTDRDAMTVKLRTMLGLPL